MCVRARYAMLSDGVVSSRLFMVDVPYRLAASGSKFDFDGVRLTPPGCPSAKCFEADTHQT
jgi:hypothetical protein